MRSAGAAFVVGLLVGASLHHAGASRFEPAPATAVVEEADDPVELDIEEPEPVVIEEPELRPAWRDAHPDDEQPWDDDAGCAIDILTALELDILFEHIITLLDWSDYAYGGPCAYWEVMSGGRGVDE